MPAHPDARSSKTDTENVPRVFSVAQVPNRDGLGVTARTIVSFDESGSAKIGRGLIARMVAGCAL